MKLSDLFPACAIWLLFGPITAFAQRLPYADETPDQQTAKERAEKAVLSPNNPAIPVLAEHLFDPDHTVRQASVLALEAPGSAAKSTTAQLVQVLADQDRIIRIDAGRTLAELGLVSVPAIIPMLQHPDPAVRVLAARTITQIEEPAVAAVPSLTLLLRDPDHSVRQAAIYAIERMGTAGKPAIPYLADLYHDSDGFIRADAARTLTKLGPDAIPSVVMLMSDPSPIVRKLAAATIRQMGADAAANSNTTNTTRG